MMNTESQALPLALQIGASIFHSNHHEQQIDAILAEPSPYQTAEEILEMFRAAMPDGRSCAVEAVLWACRCAVTGAAMHADTRVALVDFIDQLAREVDAMHGGGK